jgi:cobalt/nickel transport system permease protein
MHIPDGFINAGMSVGAGAAAAGALSIAVKRASMTLADRHVPLAGLVAAFVFAAQMLNFPVAAGTSGHLIGGVLAAVLVGPWVGPLCVAVVLLVQALFADGGITALGLNILNMSFVAAVGGYLVFAGLRQLLPKSKLGITISCGVAAGVSVPLAALAFVIEYALGGTVGVSLDAVIAAMVGVHILIGIGEAVITATTVAAVLGVRPDLVYGANGVFQPLQLRGPSTPLIEA